MTKNMIRGVIAAVPTPFSPAGEIDTCAFVEHGRWCLDHGCDALNVLGTTGEANSLSVTKRRLLMQAAAEALPRQRLMVGTGAPDLETAIALTRLAAELGYAAALILPPYYYKPLSDEGLFAWFAALVAQTEGKPVDIYLYNFPQLTGIEFSPQFAARLRAAFPDRIKGVKDSSGNLDYARRLAAISGFAVFPSNETSLAGATDANFAGCISATVNVDPASSAALWTSQADKGLQDRVKSVRQAVSAYPLVAAVKHLVRKRSGSPVWNNVAPPNLAMSDPTALKRLDEIAADLASGAMGRAHQSA